MNRLDETIEVNESEILNGLLYTSQLLCSDLSVLMQSENRFFGIVLSYFNSINFSFGRCDFEDQDMCGRVVFLCKPLILREYVKLQKHRVTKADCVIVILKKMLEIIVEYKDFDYERQAKSILKVITKLFNNIRNKGKNTSLFSFSNAIKSYIINGYVGKYPSKDFSLLGEEKKEKTPILGNGIKINEDKGVECKDLN